MSPKRALSKNLLQDLYDRLSITGISNTTGHNRTFVFCRLKKLGIKTRSLSEAQRLWKCNHIVLSEVALEFLTGELLGDGHLDHSGPVSSAYSTSSKHKEYVTWLSNILKGFGIEQTGSLHCQIGICPDSDPSKTYRFRTFHYASRRYVELRALQKKWYNAEFKKRVPEDLKLTPLACRQWYIGDGSLSRSHNITLNTQGFRPDEVVFLIDLLKNLELKVTYHKDNSIYVCTQSTPDFLNYMGPCPDQIKPVFGYKWEERS